MSAQSRHRDAAPADRLHFAEMEPVTVGMPQLCRVGLSENWLLKESGHRHWLALAHAFGLDRPLFASEAGDRLYPAFTLVALSDTRLDAVGEDDRLDFALDLERIGRSRFASGITVDVAGETVASIRMETAFVRRTVAGRNRSATRASVARPCRLLPPGSRGQRPFRADGWDAYCGFRREDRRELARFVIDPSPHEDFNGADFLYFSAFQAMIDRAEWHWLRRVAPELVTRDRTIHYFGNLELGDRVIALLCGLDQVGTGHSHWVELRRESDAGLIAVSFAVRGTAVP